MDVANIFPDFSIFILIFIQIWKIPQNSMLFHTFPNRIEKPENFFCDSLGSSFLKSTLKYVNKS